MMRRVDAVVGDKGTVQNLKFEIVQMREQMHDLQKDLSDGLRSC